MDNERDPRKDPRPGDVIQMQAGWNRKVLARNEDDVTFEALYFGELIGPYTRPLDYWWNGTETTEVLYVAE